MLFIENEDNIEFDAVLLEQICNNHTEQDVELLLINASYMRELNKEHRNIDKTTDVLSFPIEPFPHAPLGSIVINYELANEKALELGHSKDAEIALLFIHGMLHILGYDHETDNGEMRKKEEEWIKNYNLPKSLIVRTED